MRPGDWSQLPSAEKRKAAALFLFFFLVIASFWIQKPLRTSGLLFSGGITALPWAKMLVAVAVLPVLVLYAALTRRLAAWPRWALAAACAGAFAAGLAGFALLGREGRGAALAYYLFVDVFVTVMVALFWSLAHESTPPAQARRLYGLAGAGGILGGAAGSSLTGWLSASVAPPALLWTAAALLLPLPLLARVLGPPASPDGRGPSLRAAWSGARLTVASPYLRAIAAIVVLYEMSSNVVDYLFNALALGSYRDEAALAGFLGRFNAGVIAASIAVQLGLTGALLRRRGPRPGLLLLPAALAAGTLLFLAVPSLAAASLLFLLDGSLHYSVDQTSKEALYTPLRRREQYEAKAFIDILLFRGAKALSALLIAGFNLWLLPRGWPLRSLGALVLLCAAAWLPAAARAGRRFGVLERRRAARRSPAAAGALVLLLLALPAPAADAARRLERVLGAPGRLLELPWWPIGRALDLAQRHALFERVEDLLYFNEARTAGWFPNLASTGSGRGAGLLVFHDDLRGSGERAQAGFTVAGAEEFFARARYAGDPVAGARGGGELEYARDADVELYAGAGPRLGWDTTPDDRRSHALTRLRGRLWRERRRGRLRAGLFASAERVESSARRAGLEPPAGLPGLARRSLLAGGGARVALDAAPGGERAVRGARLEGELEAAAAADGGAGFARESALAELFLPLPAPRRALALRGRWERLRDLGARRAPLTSWPVLDSESGLRGFRRLRFRAPGAASLSAEYRWPVWEHWDALYFVDAGQSFAREDELRWTRWSAGHGPGVRFLSERRLLLSASLGFTAEGRRLELTLGKVF